MPRFPSDFAPRRLLAPLLAALPCLLPGLNPAPASAQVRGGLAEGLEIMGRIDALPLLYPPGTMSHQFSSFDKTGHNEDGSSRSFIKYNDTTANGVEHVIFDAYGPGCLYRHHMNAWKSDLGSAIIRYYFDDEPKPRIEGTLDSLFDRRYAPFAPLALKDTTKATGQPMFGILYYPVAYRKRLKVTVTGRLPKLVIYYGGYTYQTYAPGTPVQTWDGKEGPLAPVVQQWSRVGEDPKPLAGNVKTAVGAPLKAMDSAVVLNLAAEGSITALKFQLDAFDPAQLGNLFLRLTWDDEAKPAVNLSFIQFFGGFNPGLLAQPKGDSLPTLMFGYRKAPRSFYSYWPMPFWKRAKVEIVNRSNKPVTVTGEIRHKPASVQKYAEGTAGHFRAAYREAAPGAKAVYFEAQGRGHVVGRLFYTAGYTMEGDEMTYIDGSRTVAMHGNGTEDDHNQGWTGTRYFTPLWGAFTTGYQDAWRLFLNDSYVFHKKIEVATEREKGGGTVAVSTFYYLAPGGENLKLSDSLDVGTPADEAAHGYSVTSGTWQKSLFDMYDGYTPQIRYDTLTDAGRAFTGSSKFTLKIDPKNQGVKLRKRLNVKGNGVQTVKVKVDGQELERPWHVVMNVIDVHHSNSNLPADLVYQGWLESDYEIPASVTQGKSQITVEMAYVKGWAKEVNEFKYWAFSHGPVSASAPLALPGRKPGATNGTGAGAPASAGRQVIFKGRGAVRFGTAPAGKNYDGRGAAKPAGRADAKERE